jgi:hypothetical protein
MTRSNQISIDVPVERPIGLKRNGIDDSWCHRRRSEMNDEEREERILSDKMRHDLKVMRRSAPPKPMPEIQLSWIRLDQKRYDAQQHIAYNREVAERNYIEADHKPREVFEPNHRKEIVSRWNEKL